MRATRTATIRLAYFLAALVNSGCVIPTLVQVRPVDLQGWGETYTFRNPDSTLHDGGYFVVEYSERPGAGARDWEIRGSKDELHVIPIIDGRATLPRKTVWKSIWASGMDGVWHPDSLTTAYVLVNGMAPYDSGPGRWFHGFIVGARWPADSPYARFGAIPPCERLNCELQPVKQPDGADVALLERLANPGETFHGYAAFGLNGRELEVIREFAENSLR